MRSLPLCLLAVLACFGPGGAHAAGPVDRPAVDSSAVDLPALERAWHGCVREAYAHQPDTRSRAGAQRGALDECRAEEDSYVAAVMAARPTDDRALTARALSWAASVAASVVDPVTGWIARLRR